MTTTKLMLYSSISYFLPKLTYLQKKYYETIIRSYENKISFENLYYSPDEKERTLRLLSEVKVWNHLYKILDDNFFIKHQPLINALVKDKYFTDISLLPNEVVLDIDFKRKDLSQYNKKLALKSVENILQIVLKDKYTIYYSGGNGYHIHFYFSTPIWNDPRKIASIIALVTYIKENASKLIEIDTQIFYKNHLIRAFLGINQKKFEEIKDKLLENIGLLKEAIKVPVDKNYRPIELERITEEDIVLSLIKYRDYYLFEKRLEELLGKPILDYVLKRNKELFTKIIQSWGLMESVSKVISEEKKNKNNKERGNKKITPPCIETILNNLDKFKEDGRKRLTHILGSYWLLYEYRKDLKEIYAKYSSITYEDLFKIEPISEVTNKLIDILTKLGYTQSKARTTIKQELWYIVHKKMYPKLYFCKKIRELLKDHPIFYEISKLCEKCPLINNGQKK